MTAAVVQLPSAAFGESRLSVVEINGRPMWLASEVASALGYEDSLSVAQGVRSRWSDDLIEGRDFVLVKDAELRELKALGLVGKNAPSVMFLTESGVDLVALLSRAPQGRALRRWLADEVLPAIRRTGEYRPVATTREVIAGAKELRQAGDRAGAARLLRQHFGLAGELEEQPTDALRRLIQGRDEVFAFEAAQALGCTKVQAGRALSNLGWVQKRKKNGPYYYASPSHRLVSSS